MATDRSQSPDRPRRISFLTLVLLTAALYFGRDVLIPLALAILISFILAPMVQRLQALRRHAGVRETSRDRFGCLRIAAVEGRAG